MRITDEYLKLGRRLGEVMMSRQQRNYTVTVFGFPVFSFLGICDFLYFVNVVI